MSAVSEFNHMAEVIPCLPKKRPGIEKLISLMSEMDNQWIERFAEYSACFPFTHPRYPVNISVNPDGFSHAAIESLKAAEMSSDEGLKKILKRADEIVKEHPRHPKTTATILDFDRK